MNRKFVLLMALMVVLAGMFSVAFRVKVVEASVTIYIRASGLVEGTSKITTSDNVTYTFKGGINDPIVVERENITIDGSGYTLQGSGSGNGFYWSDINNVTVRNTDIRNFDYCFYLNSTSLSTVSGNTITNSTCGVELYSSNSNTVFGNTITNNGGGVYLTSSNGNTIFGNTITNSTDDGVCLSMSSNDNTVFGNTITNSSCGVELFSSSNDNTVSGNTITNSIHAVYLFWDSNYNTVSENTITNNGGGVYGGSIYLGSSNNNTFFENTITNSTGYGVELSSSDNNTVSGNTITNSTTYSVFLDRSDNNEIYHNNFINNPYSACASDSPDNAWDDGYPSGGNYWSDYSDVDANLDGIGDSPYELFSIIDHYPLMGTFSDFPATFAYHVTTVCNSTISAFEFDQANRIIRFNVTGEEGIGFCRVCIPHALMGSPYTVTIDGQPPQYVNYTLYDNGTHTWIYFTYQHSTHEVEIMPEFPTWTSIMLVLIVLTIAATIHKRRLLKTSVH